MTLSQDMKKVETYQFVKKNILEESVRLAFQD
jgi:hypothetical protein